MPTEELSSRKRLIKIILTLALITIVIRIPFFSHYLNESDSPALAIALESFDLANGRPHAPGYILLVGLGKILHLFINDGNLIFVLISFIFNILSVAVFFLLARRMLNNETAALVGTALLITNPIFWFYGAVAETYSAQAFFAGLVAYLCYLNLSAGNNKIAWISAFALGLAGGIRQDLLIFLLPLWLFSQLWRSRSLKKLGLCLLILTVTVLSWYLPLIYLAGGFALYNEISTSQIMTALRNSSIFFAPSRAWIVANFVRYFLFHFLVIGILWIPLGWNLIRVRRIVQALRGIKTRLKDPRFYFIILWILPATTFYLLFHMAKPGYLMTYLGALYIIGAALTMEMSRDIALFMVVREKIIAAALTAVLALGSTAYFLLMPNFAPFVPQTEYEMKQIKKADQPAIIGKALVSIFCFWTAQGIKDTDRAIANYLDAIRKYPHEDSVVVVAGDYNVSGQQIMYYLRDYKVFTMIKHIKMHCIESWLHSKECPEIDNKIYVGAKARRIIYLDAQFLDTDLREQKDISVVNLPLNHKLYVIPLAPGKEFKLEGWTLMVADWPGKGAKQ